MSSNLDVFRAYIEASSANPPSSNLEAIVRYLSDDFQSLDIDGNNQMNREQYLGMVQLIFSAFKDFKTKISDAHEEGDNVIVTSHFEGTHTGDFDLTAVGAGVIPASDKKIVWPEANTKWKIEGEKIASIQANDENSGMGPFLAALGVRPPSA